MKLLLLVIITTWSFGVPYPANRTQIVSSEYDAAMIVYNDKKHLSTIVEPDQKEYKLYEIDIDSGTVKEVPLPEVKIDYVYKKD